MRFIEYILVAVLGSSGIAAAGTPGGPSTRTITADAVTQATGGSPGKQTGTGRKGRSHARRHHRRGHRKVYTEGKKPTKG
jgi:hypothetical protein